jgi:hypothetical protein
MTCERCEFIEEEYVKAESEDLTRDALILALATLRIERNKLRDLADTAAHEQGIAQRRMLEAQEQRNKAHREVRELRDAITLVLDADALKSHAFECGDDDASIYMILKSLIRPVCRFCGEQKAPDKICGHCAEDL